ncbi:GNAT family N-acetyltransferase [Streptomyces sp. Je 1-79]|uniref:GNAT family N-acetyltransferase n=1 Tax=Streptomyces sp. Je 1-79 TaxID=2943847 RepID=UPI0021A8EF34|nr:GNAT family N-acetyltransferase [Streptomyces sp. Je 1-79]MCT4353155.1 GNAT family N-acetyltransferase [Streptomyces sp. Je 1-79]
MPIREALPRDAAAIAAVHVRSWQAAYGDLLPRSWLAGLDVDERAAVWSARLAAPEPPSVLVATEADGRAVGFCSFRAWPEDDLDPATTGEIAALYVLPEVWGSGVGRGLLAASEKALTADGFQEAALWVLAENARGRRFYEAAGWRADGTVAQETTGGRTLDELRYRRSLFT